ncbi:MAG: toxin-activating lysine-acyltransferase [Rhodoluna sp.]
MLKLAIHDCATLDPVRQRIAGAVSLILAEDTDWEGDLRKLLAEEILPCARHGKIAFFLNFDQAPVGFVTWAHLSQETEERVLQTMDPWLHISEWNEGPSPWVRCLHLPRGLRREGLRLCLDELFPSVPAVRLMLHRKAELTVLELERPVVERMARLIR